MKKKHEIWWCIKSPRVGDEPAHLLPFTTRHSSDAAIERVCEKSLWETFTALGYRAVKIKVEEV